MNKTSTRRVHKIDDQTLFQALKDVQAVFPGLLATINFSVMPGIPMAADAINDQDDLIGRFAFEQANMVIATEGEHSLTINFYRSIKENNSRIPSATFDEFDIIAGENFLQVIDHAKINRVISIISRTGLPHRKGERVDEDGTLRELIVGFGATHRQMLASLNNAILDIENKRAEAETTFEKKENERLAAHKKALAEIDVERSSLQLQSYRAERRRILQQMTDERAANLRKELTPRGAIFGRWAIFLVAILLSIFAAGLAYQSTLQLGVDDAVVQKITEKVGAGADASAIGEVVRASLGPTNWFLIARSIASSLVMIGGLAYAAAWLRGFYNSEVSAARDIDRFNYDLVRAGWIIETILEVKHEHKGEVPQEWIEGVTRGLFDSQRTGEALDDGAQALRALMGFTASASFGPEGPRFDIGRKDAKKLSKADQGDASQ